ncbi:MULTISPECIES: transcriptional regulator PpsR [unclassified Methylibium]|jgi:transcriptional regulator PpsR|uniref:transcriptional regulator PpsR n=1 Tax=unclassified Methylibium TaxID=2633235 RepID=UPI0006F2A95F|nr:transcriptional regulator PpsR [Methylibium sp. Root1272]KQW74188.1 transcriptional regulator PpsR [Methylibium sp. Root1272]
MKSFDEPSLSLGDLDAEAAGRLIAASSDVALIVDGEGIIRDLAFGNDELSKAGYQDWLGKSWAQTVTVESRPKVEALLRELGGKGAPKWRHINHPSADGADLPLLYAAVPVGSKGHALAVGRSVAFGRDLRANAALQQRLVSAQQSMERDYWRMRHMETRYRVLFQVSSEPVLILDAATLKLEDANPAASKLLGDATQRAGWSLARAFDAAGQAAVDELFAAVRATGRSDTVKARLGKDGSEWTVSASLFRQEKSSHFLVRLSALRHAAELPKPSPKDMLLRLVESAPDGFVVTDLDGLILTANQAFLDLAQLATEEQARGVSLEKWLGRTGVDLSVLISNLRQRGAVRLFATSMRGEYGSTSEVEISAVAVTEGEQPCLGFTIRDVGRRLPSDARASREVPRSVGQMTELVGRVPLREIVRDTTDLIEQLCIEAALQLTRDNRASAAEMLGLSRQSLYVKLRRYGLGDATVESES